MLEELFGIKIEERYLRIILGIGVLLIGSLITGSFFAGLTLALLFIWVRQVAFFQNGPQGLFKSNGLNDQQEFINVFLLLTAAVIKADKRIYKKEKDLVRRRLEEDFSPNQVNKYMANLEVCLKNRVKVSAICHSIKHKIELPAKLQLLNFLTGVAVSNGILVDAEYELLAKIARILQIPTSSFLSILAMFKFKRITSFDQSQSHSKSRSHSKPRTNTSALSAAYLILEIKSTASDAEVKKAFRNLAKLHHPDRVAHLGPQFQKNAKTKFQKIADAYETIKQKRGFK